MILKKNQLTNKLTTDLFDTIQNYECSFFDRQQVLKQLIYTLYDNDIVNDTELIKLFTKIETKTT